MAYNLGRLDQIVVDLERLQDAADDIINGYVSRIVSEASSVLDRVGALKIVRRALTGNDK